MAFRLRALVLRGAGEPALADAPAVFGEGVAAVGDEEQLASAVLRIRAAGDEAQVGLYT
ncbi:hypothetical protein ACIQWV_29525 [Streptomyces sp. NPDC098085]|uniref:hypothetical protein n=1 Tax=Streptomyces sp. NPDC098085 TaxID=3366094 RepID=UPI0038068C20